MKKEAGRKMITMSCVICGKEGQEFPLLPGCPVFCREHHTRYDIARYLGEKYRDESRAFPLDHSDGEMPVYEGDWDY